MVRGLAVRALAPRGDFAPSPASRPEVGEGQEPQLCILEGPQGSSAAQAGGGLGRRRTRRSQDAGSEAGGVAPRGAVGRLERSVGKERAGSEGRNVSTPTSAGS